MSEQTISLVDLDVDADDQCAALVALLGSNRFPFHVDPTSSPATIERRIADGAWGGSADGDGDHRTLWVVHDGEHVGVVRLDELTDDAPLFDLRLAEAHRGRGIGRGALRAIADLVFTEYPQVERLEGQTREDNLAMRHVFERGGWTKEAHYRRGWPVADGAPVASVAYAILREEWETGERVPLIWDDLPR